MKSRHSLLQYHRVQIALVFFVILSIFWLKFQFSTESDLNDYYKVVWAACYQIVAIWGGIWGLVMSRYWGGHKSIIGKAMISFALGLLFQAFGQSVYSFYNLYLIIEVPYPSIGDFGFFGSIPLYIYGTVLLARAAGAKISLRSFGRKIQAIIIPVMMLIITYYFFLRTYEADWTNILQIFLDFGYPFGQAIYISLALLTFLLSKNVLGGLMRHKIFLMLVALLIQYVADYNFLYQASNETWSNGNYGDYIYLIAYLAMSLSLFNLDTDFLQKPKDE